MPKIIRQLLDLWLKLPLIESSIYHFGEKITEKVWMN